MATRVMAIAVELIDQNKADGWNTKTGLSLTTTQWQAAFGVLMADGEIQGALTSAKNREAAWRSVIGALAHLSDTAVAAGEPDYMATAVSDAVSGLTTALERPYNPATDGLASDME